MNRSFVSSLAAIILLAFVTTGCVHRTHSRGFSAKPRAKTVALAITVAGGGAPTPGQWAAILKVVEPQLTAKGWVLVTDYSAAASILRIDFSPSPHDPENSGHASVLSFRQNPLGALVTRSSRSSSPGYSYVGHVNGSPHFYGYDRYDRFYDDYYTYYSHAGSSSASGAPASTTPAPGTTPTQPSEILSRAVSESPTRSRFFDHDRGSSGPSYRTDPGYSRPEPSSSTSHSSSDSSSSASSSASSSSSSFSSPSSFSSSPGDSGSGASGRPDRLQ